MIAYNTDWLNNLNKRKDVEDAFDEACITRNEYETINKEYPVGFYSPNIFIGIGLLLLTIVIASFSFGLFALIFMSSIERMIGILAILFAGFCYAALEYMIKIKHHYRSGVDDALLWIASITLFCGISLPNDFSDLTNCLIIFIICLCATIRYADKFIAAVLYLSFIGILFYGCLEIGTLGKVIAPFLIMLASLGIYIVIKKIAAKKSVIHYSGCFEMIEIVSLISLYVAGNYFIVRELSNSMFGLNLHPGEGIPYGWIFWVFTICLPVIYLWRGIHKKDTILIRVSLLLFAALVFTIRYYYTIFSMEVLMTISGVVLLAITYLLMKWLHEPKAGFTSQLVSLKNETDKLNIESLIIAQTFKPGAEAGGTQFGGGSFGGGGASGDY